MKVGEPLHETFRNTRVTRPP